MRWADGQPVHVDQGADANLGRQLPADALVRCRRHQCRACRKLVVLVEIVRGRLWAYPGLIALTALFAAYQLYHMAVTGLSAGYLALTLFDLLIIALTTVEYAKLRSPGSAIAGLGRD